MGSTLSTEMAEVLYAGGRVAWKCDPDDWYRTYMAFGNFNYLKFIYKIMSLV